LISAFVQAESARGVVVIGGLPTDFTGAAPSPGALAVLATAYPRFLALPNLSLYPRRDFFNSEDHLAKPCQYLHSLAVAAALADMLHRPLHAAPPGAAALARTCPGG